MQLLIPLSFSSMLGGMCTLLGTSTNLILQDLAAQSTPPFAISMFSMTSVGGPVALVGIAVMVAGSSLLPGHANGGGDGAGAALSYTSCFRCTAAAAGRSAAAIGLAAVPGAQLVQLRKEKSPPGLSAAIVQLDRAAAAAAAAGEEEEEEEEEPLAAAAAQGGGALLERPLSQGDVLTFHTTADGIAALRKFRELLVDKQEAIAALGAGRRHRRLFEASLAVSSPLVGEPLDSAVALATYNCAILAHRPFAAASKLWSGLNEHEASADNRNTSRSSASLSLPSSFSLPTLRGRPSPKANPMDSKAVSLLDAGYLAEEGGGSSSSSSSSSSSPSSMIPKMQQGDTIVIEAPETFALRQGASSHFSVTRELKDSFAPRFDKDSDRVRMQVAGAILALMVVLAASGAYVIFSAALFAAMLLIAAQCLTIEEALASVKGRVILAICATYGLGSALKTTGVASAIASGLVSLGLQIGNIGLLAMLFLCTAVLSCVVSNQATVILLWPVIESIQIPGLHLGQFAITLMMGASTAFITPIGYQTSLMVFGPGNYAFGDFVKIGGLITLVLTPVTALLVYYTV